MLYIPRDETSDPWYNLGQIAGLALGKAYEARTAREAGKQMNNQKAQELYDIQNQQNQALQGAYNAYIQAKQKEQDEGQLAAKNYNDNPTPENFQKLVDFVHKVHPGAEINNTAMTDALNYSKSGQSASLQPYRQAAMSAAQVINPYVDFSSSDWGTDTYNMGLNRANYTKNFEESNKGKTINGKGDKKYRELVDYNNTNPYNAMPQGPLQPNLPQAQPLNLKFNTPSSSPMALQDAKPLGNYFNFGGLQKYVNQ